VSPHVPAAVGSFDYNGVPLKTLDPGHLTYVLINAVKELTTRLEALEAAGGVPAATIAATAQQAPSAPPRDARGGHGGRGNRR